MGFLLGIVQNCQREREIRCGFARGRANRSRDRAAHGRERRRFRGIRIEPVCRSVKAREHVPELRKRGRPVLQGRRPRRERHPGARPAAARTMGRPKDARGDFPANCLPSARRACRPWALRTRAKGRARIGGTTPCSSGYMRRIARRRCRSPDPSRFGSTCPRAGGLRSPRLAGFFTPSKSQFKVGLARAGSSRAMCARKKVRP